MRNSRFFIWAAVLSGVWTLAARAQEQRDFVYKSPAGVEFRVSANGLESIKVGDRQLASGQWAIGNGHAWFKEFKDIKGGPRVEKTTAKSLDVSQGNKALVRHENGDIRVAYTYTFDGDDVLISARIENAHESAALHVAAFSGLVFNFDSLPKGLMYVQHSSYFQAHGVGLCHPSHWAKVGGSWAADSSAGVGTSPRNTGLSRTLTLWDYASWEPRSRENDPKRKLLYFAVQDVPPRGAATVDLMMRVSPNRDWKHLLAPYREHFARTFGPVQYKADHRFVATDYLNHSPKAVSPDNPYGFHGGHRRIDTAEGAKKFCDLVIPLLKNNGGQGVIVWGQGGDDPRGGMYRPDFDILPPEVEAQWPAIAKRFSEAGVKLGVTTRPREMAVRANWTQDQIININPDDPGHQRMLWRRFETMIKKGCTLFYLDTFGDGLADVKLMRFLREKMGPEVLTFCEHQCDAIMPYSGAYSECSFNGAEGDRPGAYRLWSGVENWEIYQYLSPGSQMASRLYQVKGRLPAGTAGGPDEWFFAHRITTLLPTNDQARAAAIRELWPRFVDENGKWK